MNFASDNWSGVAPEISQSLLSNSTGFAAAYGDSELEVKVKAKFCEVFEKEVAVFFVGSGTIANSLSIASFAKPGGITLCHREAHIVVDECGGPELFSGGGRLVPVHDPSVLAGTKTEVDFRRIRGQSYGPRAVRLLRGGESGEGHDREPGQDAGRPEAPSLPVPGLEIPEGSNREGTGHRPGR